MTETPQIQPLAYRKRKGFFVLLLLVFLFCVPVFDFYASGYRYDFFAASPTITATGGAYVSSQVDDTDIFVDEDPVGNLRIFRNAAYIQGLEPGIHRIHVQGEGVHTWVKELPIYSQIVTEAEAFTLPLITQVRPIAESISLDSRPVYIGSTTTVPFRNASTSIPFEVSNTMTSGYIKNPEYVFIESLFSTSTATTTTPIQSFIGQISETFQFSSDVSTPTTSTSTLTVNDMMLFERNGTAIARWLGNERDIPYYFCIPHESIATTTSVYGAHVMRGVATAIEATTESELLQNDDEARSVCRSEIRIGSAGKKLFWFNFLPESNNHVLLLLEDGIYVSEIDDRGWQNLQPLYLSETVKVVIEGDQIFIEDNGYFAEVFTEIQT